MSGSGEDEDLGSEEVLPSDEEEERGSSAEEGSDDGEEGSDDGEEGSDEEGSDEDYEEGSDDGDGDGGSARSRTKKRKFVMPPPRALPSRTTRGARMGKVEAEEGDEEFWNQEFFAEEENDERYETESEPEDRFDADFNETEDEGDEDEEAAEAEAEAAAREKKKKALKPPGYTRPPLPKPRVKKEDGEGASAGPARGAGAPKQRRPSVEPGDIVIGRRTVRESTRQKVEEGEMERKLAEKYKPKRAAPRSSAHRQLTQAELLAEAAKTELENTKSLQLLEAIELEHRQRANVVKRRYAGPMVRWKSRRVGDAEVTTIEVRNMSMPEELQRRLAPEPPPPAVCAVTGQPARFRDPATGLPYATLDAFKELRRRRDAGLLGGPAGGVDGGAQQQQQAGAPGSGTRYSTRHAAAAAAAASPAQFLPLQQALYQPELALAQDGQQAAWGALGLPPAAGGIT